MKSNILVSAFLLIVFFSCKKEEKEIIKNIEEKKKEYRVIKAPISPYQNHRYYNPIFVHNGDTLSVVKDESIGAWMNFVYFYENHQLKKVTNTAGWGGQYFIEVNNQGKISKIKEIGYYDKHEGMENIFIAQYLYDVDAKIIQINYEHRLYNDGVYQNSRFGKRNYFYNSDGNIIKEIDSMESINYVMECQTISHYTYDNKPNPTYKLNLNAFSIYPIVSQESKNNLLTREIIFFRDNSKLNYYYSYEYFNNLPKSVEIVTTDQTGSMTQFFDYEYEEIK